LEKGKGKFVRSVGTLNEEKHGSEARNFIRSAEILQKESMARVSSFSALQDPPG